MGEGGMSTGARRIALDKLSLNSEGADQHDPTSIPTEGHVKQLVGYMYNTYTCKETPSGTKWTYSRSGRVSWLFSSRLASGKPPESRTSKRVMQTDGSSTFGSAHVTAKITFRGQNTMRGVGRHA